MGIEYLVAVLLVSQPLAAHPPPTTAPPDEAAVRAAVLDYVDSIYQVQPSKLAGSIATDLNKLGVMFKADGTTSMPTMSFDQLVELARTYNANNRIPAGAKKNIQILDIQSHIANAKLEAAWGVDYLLLTKSSDGEWVIRQVLWQARR